ncbi:iron-hydroxamate ABC transporter substrate-binding protein [Brevibacillus sp. BC25]|uniref:iron-hydroxamate ABC transporter substrate-binding protein n=1 Tax=Brevibacillus sp. BC25 TaxID=1144308 RepID=UPI0002712944|nr:iron-hydroxamate ABC transporter substrate-binding protein [Brevibacillus sp. BC25]EJL26165.1 ABC-type Fe3+-hydroxamate transport system, periplasmic component [Brevibacillus sp. BC25]
MKKAVIPVILMFMLLLSACGSQQAQPAQPETPAAGNETKEATVIYQSEKGPVEVPAQPKRIIGLTNAPNIVSMEGTLVGVDQWTKQNPLFTEKLKDVEVVSDADLEKILALKPDLIVAGSEMKNLDQFSKIAPTVVFSWGKLDYLSQQLEIGKLLNKEKEAQTWMDDFKSRAKTAGEQIKAKIGENATVSVFEYDTKDFYVFGNNWARGTEILYQAMGLNMSDKVKKDVLGPGYYKLSLEAIPDYAGDYLVLSRRNGSTNDFLQSATWKNVPAVKQNRIIEIDTEASTYSDPITLEYLLKIFTEQFLTKS